MRKILSLVLSLTLVLTMIPQLALAAGESEDYSGKTVVIYTGNLRGDVDVYPKVATAKKDFEDKGADVYLVDAGNYLQGTTYANSTRGKAIYDLMDAAGYDVAAMGAYEFAYEEASTGQKYHGNFTKYHTQKMLYLGQEEMEYNKNMPGSSKGILEKVTAPGFKVISSNIEGTSSVAVDNAAAIGNPEQLYAFDQNAVLTSESKGALNVGFEALTDKTAPEMIQDNYFNGLSFMDTPSAPKGADVIVGLSNNGSDVDDAAVTIEAPTNGQKVVGAYEIDNATREANEIESFDIKEYSDDSAVAEKVSNVKNEAKPVIAKSDINLIGKNSLHRSQETEMGNLVADALLWYAKSGKLEGFKNDAPVVAIQNGGNVRETIYSGDIIDLDLFHAYPYSPAGVGILYVTGEQLLESLEEANQTNPINAFPHVAGMKYNLDKDAEYDASTTKGEKGDGTYSSYYFADSYNRVTITSVNGEEFDPEARYAVVADNMVIFNGLDTYGTFKSIKEAGTEGKDWINNGNGILTRDVVAAYLKESCGGVVPDVYSDVQDRISFDSNEALYEEMSAAADTAIADAAKAKAKADASKKAADIAAKTPGQAAVNAANKAKADAEAAKAAADKADLAAKNAAAVADKTEDPELINAAKAKVDQTEKAAKEAAKAVEEAGKAVDKAKSDKAAADKAAADKAAAEKAMKKVKTVTVNVKTVNAKALAKAVAKAKGSSKYVTKFIIGKNVKKIAKSSFKAYKKITVLQIKTKKLTKKSVKGSLKGSKVKKIQVKVGSKKVNKKYVKKYKKIFTKKNAGKNVKVK